MKPEEVDDEEVLLKTEFTSKSFFICERIRLPGSFSKLIIVGVEVFGVFDDDDEVPKGHSVPEEEVPKAVPPLMPDPSVLFSALGLFFK